MPTSPRDSFRNLLPGLLAAGVLLTGPGLLLATPPVAENLPAARQDGDDEEAPNLLSEDQINLIQVYEIDLDTEPRVRIDQDVLREFLEDPDYASRDGMPTGRTQIRDFLRAEGYQQLGLFFQMRAREYYAEVQVREEPDRLRAWQRINSRYINQYFMNAFANKPLGEGVQLRYQGRPIDEIPLIAHGRDAETIAYTNFYILSQMTADGVPMIDRSQPEESIIVQWALPREDAVSDAPDVAGWRPHFRSMEDDDPRREELINWIESLINGNQDSQYGIEFAPSILGEDEEDQG